MPSKTVKEKTPVCEDCGFKLTLVGHGIGWECLNKKSPCRKITQGEMARRVLARFGVMLTPITEQKPKRKAK